MQIRYRVEALMACVLIPPALELLPATRVLGAIARLPRRAAGAATAAASPPPEPEALARYVDRQLLRLPWIWHRTCLRRASVLAALLRRDGREVEVVIGVRRNAEGALEAHAWLRSGSEEPYLEPGETASFIELRRVSPIVP